MGVAGRQKFNEGIQMTKTGWTTQPTLMN